ncbi:MAG: DUF5686 family protein, partial [Saprospiraceae bacterium]
RETENTLAEVLVRPGENPADRIIRLVVAQRDRHDPDRRSAYACTIYGKQSVQTNADWRGLLRIYAAMRDSSRYGLARDSADLSPHQRRRLRRLDQGRKKHPPSDHDALLVESVVRRYFLYPDQLKQEVLLNRVSGFQDLPVAAIADLVQPFSFYRDYIPLIDKAFVNPIGPNSPELYFFNLEDTLYQGRDTLYVISFQPHRGRVFDALRGTLCINTNGWAVQNVRAEPANKNSNLWIRIEQQYQQLTDEGGVWTDSLPSACVWFPEQLDFELAFGDASGLQIRATGRSRVSDVFFHPALHATDFDPEIPLVFRPHASSRADTAWAYWHTRVPLSKREERTFAHIDSFGQRHHFQRIEWAARVASSEVAPLVSGLGFNTTKFFTFNDFEKIRFGLGLTTSQPHPYQLAHRFDAEGWAGFGWADRRWKYGASLSWRSGRLRSTALSLGYINSLYESGSREGWLDFRGGFDGSLYAKTMNRLQETSLSLRGKPLQGLSYYLSLRAQKMSPTYPYAFLLQPERPAGQPFRFTESVGSLRYAWGELANELANADWQLQQRAPVVELIWMHGWRGFLQGQYDYDRLVLALYQARFIRRLGKLKWRAEVGIVSGKTPFPKLFSLSQPGGQGLISAFVVANSIQTADTLVISDHYVNLFFSQQIGNILYRRRWSAPYLNLLQNAAWGSLRRPEDHAGIKFRSLEKPLLESGVRLDDLLRIDILHFGYLGGGLAVFYGWGPYAYADWRKNVALRAAVRWSF